MHQYQTKLLALPTRLAVDLRLHEGRRVVILGEGKEVDIAVSIDEARVYHLRSASPLDRSRELNWKYVRTGVLMRYPGVNEIVLVRGLLGKGETVTIGAYLHPNGTPGFRLIVRAKNIDINGGRFTCTDTRDWVTETYG